MLTAKDLQAFRTDGYLVIEDVVTDILPSIRAEYQTIMDRLWAQWALDDPARSFEDRIIAAYRAGCEYFQPMDISLPLDPFEPDVPFHAGQAVFSLITHPALLDIVEGLIGPEITSNPIQHVRIKPPADDMRSEEKRAHITSTDWHQDRGVTQEIADNTNMITVWVAITDATLQNGCLQALRGQHHGPLLPHCPLPQVGIPAEHIDKNAVTPLPVKAGGIVILHPMTPHASLSNCTSGIRWSFDLRYNVTGQPTGRDQFPDFVARSANDPQSALKSAREWEEKWRATRAELAVRPRREFYRWDHDAPYCA